jgi:hypothetical protein
VTDSIGQRFGDQGPAGIVMSLGWVGMAFIVGAWLHLYIFGTWASRKTDSILNEKTPEGGGDGGAAAGEGGGGRNLTVRPKKLML